MFSTVTHAMSLCLLFWIFKPNPVIRTRAKICGQGDNEKSAYHTKPSRQYNIILQEDEFGFNILNNPQLLQTWQLVNLVCLKIFRRLVSPLCKKGQFHLWVPGSQRDCFQLMAINLHETTGIVKMWYGILHKLQGFWCYSLQDLSPYVSPIINSYQLNYST